MVNLRLDPRARLVWLAAVPPDEYFPMIERICHENEILLIVDDVEAAVDGARSMLVDRAFGDAGRRVVVAAGGAGCGHSPASRIA